MFVVSERRSTAAEQEKAVAFGRALDAEERSAELIEPVEMLPCPFCGGEGCLRYDTYELDAGYHVVCHGNKNCPLYCSNPYRVFDTEAEAITVWNTRSSQSDREAVLEEAEAAVERLRSSGENSDNWTITRDLAFHAAKEAIRSLKSSPSSEGRVGQ